jgi:glycosyltransferase involved in cell wall biosynthesis
MSLGQVLRNALGIRLGVLVQYSPRKLDYARVEHPTRINIREALPKICIVTPSFNQGRFIRETLASIDSENYPNLEHIVQDCLSSDETSVILGQHEQPHRKVYFEKDSGQGDAINRGFNRSNAQIMGYLNSDDVLMPGALWEIGRVFANNPSVDVVYGDRIIIDKNGDEIGRWQLPKHCKWTLLATDYVPQETMFWRRSAWDRAGGKISDEWKFAIDWDLLLRFVDIDAEFMHLPKFLGAFRVHQNQKTTVEMSSTGLSEIKELRNRARHASASRIKINVKHLLFLVQHVLLVNRFSFEKFKARRRV